MLISFSIGQVFPAGQERERERERERRENRHERPSFESLCQRHQYMWQTSCTAVRLRGIAKTIRGELEPMRTELLEIILIQTHIDMVGHAKTVSLQEMHVLCESLE